MQYRLEIKGLPPEQERMREIYAASPTYLRKQAEGLMQGVPGASAVIYRQVWQEVERLEGPIAVEAGDGQ